MQRTVEGPGAEPGPPRLVVVESLIGDDDAAHALFQMVICDEGTRGFSERDMHGLLNRAAFTVGSVDRLITGHTVFVCTPDPSV